MKRLMMLGAMVLGAAVLGTGCIVVTDVPTYDVCVDSSDCGPGDVCINVRVPTSTGRFLNGNMCSRFCSSDFDCPGANGYAGGCYMLAADPDFRNFVCYARCDGDFECDVGQQCIVATMGGIPTDSICLPR
jgi:hypothetical protein